MKNPAKELILAIGFLALLIAPMIGLTQRSHYSVEKPVSTEISAVGLPLYLNAYVEIECTSAPTALSLKVNKEVIELPVAEDQFLYSIEERFMWSFDKQVFLIEVEFPTPTKAQAVRVRIEPDSLKHREKVIWMNGSHSEEITFLWK